MIQKRSFYVVGGCVRDYFLGKDFHDIDVVVTGFSFIELLLHIKSTYEVLVPKPEYHEAIVNGTFDQVVFDKEDNANRTTVKVGVIKARTPWGVVDFCMARGESDAKYTANGTVPNEVDLGPEIKLITDLSRRDFTMNAIAIELESIERLHWSTWSNVIIDPYKGLEDIRQQTIRAVGLPYERLYHDPTRILRAIRFAISLGFMIHPLVTDTLEAYEQDLAVAWGKKVNRSRSEQELAKVFASSSDMGKIMFRLMCLPKAILRAILGDDIVLVPKLKHDAKNN